MGKENCIKRDPYIEVQEERKKEMKAFRSEIYDLLDKAKKNNSTNYSINYSQDKQML